ncbi:hypothetical protein [Streptomyces mirabilis]|uniref:hypothetical protein n=1 Tax=Streptomyces mirabilis TaxID=68239 RepID=UPI0033FBA808
MTDDPQADRSLRTVLTVTVETRPDGGHYFDQADFTAHATEWVRAALKGRHAVDEVAIVDQAAELRRAQAEAHQYRTALQGVARAAAVPSAPADRAAILREAADALVAVAGQHPEARAVVIHWGDAAALLRTMAQEECDELEAQAHLDQLADELPRMADEAQPPHHRWRIETRDPLADEWAPGSRMNSRAAAEERYAAVSLRWPEWADGAPVERRLVRETTTYTVDQPAAVSQPGKEA